MPVLSRWKIPTPLHVLPISDADGDEQAVVAEWSAVDLATALTAAGLSTDAVVEVIVSVSELAWVVPSEQADDPAAANAGVGEQFRGNLNLRLPAAFCRYVHWQAVNQANKAIITLSAVVRGD